MKLKSPWMSIRKIDITKKRLILIFLNNNNLLDDLDSINNSCNPPVEVCVCSMNVRTNRIIMIMIIISCQSQLLGWHLGQNLINSGGNRIIINRILLVRADISNNTGKQNMKIDSCQILSYPFFKNSLQNRGHLN